MLDRNNSGEAPPIESSFDKSAEPPVSCEVIYLKHFNTYRFREYMFPNGNRSVHTLGSSLLALKLPYDCA
jgi:hypothetical protein